MYTLKQIIDIVEDICNDHPQIKAVTDMVKLGDEGYKHLQSPYISYDVQDVLVDGRVSYNFVINCLTSTEEDLSDVREGQGDTAQIMVDIISSLEEYELLDQDTSIFLLPTEDNTNKRIGYSFNEYLHSSRQQCNEESD